MRMPRVLLAVAALFWSACVTSGGGAKGAQPTAPTGGGIADSHLHISNYVMQGASLKDLVEQYMGDTIARSTVMPVPLQQKWDRLEHFEGDRMPPTYYLGPRAELYYYSFVDAMVAQEYLRLSPANRARLDPMITAFNPMDQYAVQHIKRALLNFPGVFVGIGEFTVHKELVSDKLAGDPIKVIAAGGAAPADAAGAGKVSLEEPSLASILDFAAEAGLVAVLHNDIYDARVEHDGSAVELRPQDSFVPGLEALCAASPRAVVVWAHTGLGRFVAPTLAHLAQVAHVLDACPAWSTDISWDLVQKYITAPKAGQPAFAEWVAFVTKYQDRILFGSDNVLFKRSTLDSAGTVKPGARQTVAEYRAVALGYDSLWDALGPGIARKVKIGNYERLFDAARVKVRAWESMHAGDDVWDLH